MVIFGHSNSNDMDFRYDTVDAADLLSAIDKYEEYVAGVSKTVSSQKNKSSVAGA